MISGMATWVLLTSVAATFATVALFVSGALYPRPMVTRMQRAHDAEMERLTRAHEAGLAQVREDGDYYRRAAQSCAVAVAHRESQLRIVRELLEQCRRGLP